MAQVYAVSVTHNFKGSEPMIAEVRVFTSETSAKAFMDEIANRALPSYVSYVAELFTTPLEA